MAENSLVPINSALDSTNSTSDDTSQQNMPQVARSQNPFPQNLPQGIWPQNPFPQNLPQGAWPQNPYQQDPPQMTWPQNPHASNPGQASEGASGDGPMNSLHAEAQQSVDYLGRLGLAYLTYRAGNEIPTVVDAAFDGARYIGNEAATLAQQTYEAARTYGPVALTAVSEAVGETVATVAAAVGVSPPVLCVIAASVAVVGVAGWLLWRRNRNAQRNRNAHRN